MVSAPLHWPWATHLLQVTPLHLGVGVTQVGIRGSAPGGRQGWEPALPLTEYELGKPCHLKSQLAHLRSWPSRHLTGFCKAPMSCPIKISVCCLVLLPPISWIPCIFISSADCKSRGMAKK